MDRDAAYERLLRKLAPALGVSAFLQADTIAKGDPAKWPDRYDAAARAVREYAEAVADPTRDSAASGTIHRHGIMCKLLGCDKPSYSAS